MKPVSKPLKLNTTPIGVFLPLFLLLSPLTTAQGIQFTHGSRQLHGVDSVIAEYIQEIESEISLPDSVLILGMLRVFGPSINTDSAVGRPGVILSLSSHATGRYIEVATVENGVYWYALSRAEAQQGIRYRMVDFNGDFINIGQLHWGTIYLLDGVTFSTGFATSTLSATGEKIKGVELLCRPLQSARIFLKNNPEGKWSKFIRKLLPAFKSVESVEVLLERDDSTSRDSIISVYSQLFKKMPWSRLVQFYAITWYLEKFVYLMENKQKQEATHVMQEVLQIVEKIGKQSEWILYNLSDVFLDRYIEIWTYEYLIGKFAEGREKYQLLYELYDDWSANDKQGALCREWIQDFPEDRDAHIYLLDYYIHHASDSVSAALKVFHSALSKDIKFEPEQYQYLASICLYSSMFKETCKILECIPLLAQPDWRMLQVYVTALDSLGNRKKAKEVVFNALQRLPADTSHRVGKCIPLIESCLILGMEQEALSILQYELKKRQLPERTGFRYVIARSYREYNKPEISIKILEEGIADDSSSAILWDALGDCYAEDLKDYRESADCYRMAVKYTTHRYKHYTNKQFNALVFANKKKEALNLIKTFVEESPSRDEYIQSVQDWCQKANADDLFQKAFPNRSFIKEAKKYLGVTYQWGGRNTEKNPGLDCMGLIFLAYSKVYKKPWTELSVYPSKIIKKKQLGKPVDGLDGVLVEDADTSKMENGDIIFLLSTRRIDDKPITIDTKEYYVWHMGIYIKPDSLLQANPLSKVVEITKFREFLESTDTPAIFITRAK